MLLRLVAVAPAHVPAQHLTHVLHKPLPLILAIHIPIIIRVVESVQCVELARFSSNVLPDGFEAELVTARAAVSLEPASAGPAGSGTQHVHTDSCLSGLGCPCASWEDCIMVGGSRAFCMRVEAPNEPGAGAQPRHHRVILPYRTHVVY